MSAMMIKKSRRPKGVYYSIVRGVWDPVAKQSRTRTVRSLGYGDALAAQYGDADAYANRILQECIAEAEKETVHADFDLNEQFDLSGGSGSPAVYADEVKNLGYGIVKSVYLQMDFPRFWSWKARSYRAEYSVDRVFRLLVFGRILFPGSPERVWENRHRLFEPMNDFTLDDVRHAQDILSKCGKDIQTQALEQSRKLCPGDPSRVYLHVAKDRFRLTRPDAETGDPGDGGARVADPPAGLCLLADASGLPLGFDLIPGDKPESIPVQSVLRGYRQACPGGRVVVVSDSAPEAAEPGFPDGESGYLCGRSIRNAPEEFREWVLRKDDYMVEPIPPDRRGDATALWIHKSRVVRRGKAVEAGEKQVVWYSEEYARHQKARRESDIARSLDLIARPQKYDRATAAGFAPYIGNLSFREDTGEVAEGKDLYLDREKIAREEICDGYVCLVTSELEVGDLELIQACRNLADTENFLQAAGGGACPVSGWNRSRLEAHLTVSYVALLILRLLQALLGHEYTLEQIVRSLRKFVCAEEVENVFRILYYDEILRRLGEKLDLDLSHVRRTRVQLKRILRY